MAIFIGIKKVGKQNLIHYYHVDTCDFGGANLYIGINPKEKKLFFYETAEFINPISIASLDPKDTDKPIPPVPGISPAIYNLVILKAYRALEKNEFPEFLDYCA